MEVLANVTCKCIRIHTHDLTDRHRVCRFASIAFLLSFLDFWTISSLVSPSLLRNLAAKTPKKKKHSHQPCHQHHPVAIPTPPIPETKNCKKIIDSPAAYMAWKFQFHFYSEWSTRRHTVVKDLPGEGPQAKRSQKNNSKFSPSFGGNGKRSFPFGERAHFQGASSLVSGLFVHSCWTCECLFFDKVWPEIREIITKRCDQKQNFRIWKNANIL